MPTLRFWHESDAIETALFNSYSILSCVRLSGSEECLLLFLRYGIEWMTMRFATSVPYFDKNCLISSITITRDDIDFTSIDRIIGLDNCISF